MADKVTKQYYDNIIAGGAVRDSHGKVLVDSLEQIDNKASLLDNVVVNNINDTLSEVRVNGTIITETGVIQNSRGEQSIEITSSSASNNNNSSLRLTYVEDSNNNNNNGGNGLIIHNNNSNNNQTSQSLTLSYIN